MVCHHKQFHRSFTCVCSLPFYTLVGYPAGLVHSCSCHLTLLSRSSSYEDDYVEHQRSWCPDPDCLWIWIYRAAVIQSCTAASAPAPTIGITPVASAPGAGSGLTPSGGGLAGLGLPPTSSPSSPSSPSAASVQVQNLVKLDETAS